MNYPHMAYDRPLQRYLLSFAYWYYRDFQPPGENGPMVQGGAELIVLEASQPWGPWSFVMRNPYLGSGNGYGPSFPVQWQDARTPAGQDLWMVWAANFSHCGEPMLVPAHLCHGVYGMNLRRVHFTLAGTAGAVPRPWCDQDVGFASHGTATFQNGEFKVSGNGNLALSPDAFGQYKDHLDHDAFHYVFRRATGDAELSVHLRASAPGTGAQPGPEASDGLMVREPDYDLGQTKDQLQGRALSPGDTFSESARYGYVGVLGNGDVFFEWRDEGRVSRSPAKSHRCTRGCVVKIVRAKGQIRAFLAASLGAWREVGSHTFATPLSPSVIVGMAAASDSPSTSPRYAT